MKKVFMALVCCALAAGFLYARGAGERAVRDTVSINVMLVDGPPIVVMAELMSKGGAVKEGYDISYTVVHDPTALVAALLNQEPDFAIAPINVAAMMHNNGSGYRLAAVTWGMMHIVSNQNITSLEELRGETIIAFGRGAAPGITLREVLRQNNIEYVEPVGANFTPDPNRVHIIYLASALDVRNMILAGSFDGVPVRFGLLAEPVVTAIGGATANAAHGQFLPRINLQTEWARTNNGQIPPQAGLIFHERLLTGHADFVNRFIALAELSSLYAQNNPASAGNMAVQLGSIAIPGGAVVQAAVNADRLPIHITRAADVIPDINAYLQVILNEAPPLVGGRLPADIFFHAAE